MAQPGFADYLRFVGTRAGEAPGRMHHHMAILTHMALSRRDQLAVDGWVTAANRVYGRGRTDLPAFPRLLDAHSQLFTAIYYYALLRFRGPGTPSPKLTKRARSSTSTPGTPSPKRAKRSPTNP